MSGSKALTLRETMRAAPRWALVYLPTSALDSLVEALWLFTLGWEASRAGSAAGLVLAAGAVPAVAFVLWGGSLADRLGAHRVAIWTMAARVVVMVAWAAVVISDTAPIYLAAAAAFAVGAIAGIHDPAVSAVPQLLVPNGGLEASTNAQRISVRLVQTVGPALGGVIAGWSGIGAVVVVAAVIGLVPLAGFALLRTTRRPATDGQLQHADTGWRSLLSGFRWIARDPVIRRTVPVQGVINLTTAYILMAALPLQARASVWGADVYGFATAGFGGGMLAGTVIAFSIRARAPRHRVAIAVVCAAITSVFVVTTGWAPTAALAIVSAGLMGLFLGPVGSILTGWTMATTAAADPSMYGRVFAVLLLVTTAAEPIGYLVFSALAAVTSVGVAAATFGAAGVLFAGLALGARAVRTSNHG
jgi:hypothetical protein